MKNFDIAQFYGKNDNPGILKLCVSLIMMTFSIGMFSFSFFTDSSDINGFLAKWLFGYLSIFVFAVALFISSYYFFEKKEGSRKYEFIRKLYFIVACITLIFATFPLIITLFVLNKLNMETLFRYSGLYGISLIISLFINAVLFVLVYSYLEISFGAYINSLTICLTFLFIMNYLVLKLSGSIYLYLSNISTRRKTKLKQGIITSVTFDTWEERDRQVKKEFMGIIYVMNFAIIAMGSASIYFVKIETIFPNVPVEQLRTSVLYSFALYTAVDRLLDKWKKSLGKEGKRTNEEKSIKSLEDKLQSMQE